MKAITAYIETGSDNTFNVFLKDNLPFGFFGEGDTVEEAKKDFIENFEEMRDMHKERTGKDYNYDFIFKYDMESFFNRYSMIFSMPALEKLSGINQKQLHHYAMGIKNPREITKTKLEHALHTLGKELINVQL